jgi:hypothetical protein
LAPVLTLDNKRSSSSCSKRVLPTTTAEALAIISIIMVFYYKSRCGEYTIYMGKDKHENEDLIKFGLDEDVWFHVDDLSSAHVYARLKAGMSLDDLSDDLITDCASLVKANSIQGCKVSDPFMSDDDT